MKNLYKTTVTTKGARKGHAKSDDGLLDVQLSVPKSMGGDGGKHTNPEQLFAAGYSACFGGALQLVAENHGVELNEDFSVSAVVKLGQTEEENLQLAVVLDCFLPGVDVKTGEKLINEAHEVCPYSRATRDNIDVTLNLLIEED
jgi:Ohr subfamily peroxiredoxin